MPLQGHWELQRRVATGRERRALTVFTVALVLGAIVLVGATRGGEPAHAGCVDVTAASTTGGARLHACGADAARWCRGAEARTMPAVRAACRRARVPTSP